MSSERALLDNCTTLPGCGSSLHLSNCPERGKKPETRRPTITEVMMRVATTFGERSTCPRAQVGAVAAKDNRIVATGYVGAPSGEPHCLDVGCEIDDEVCLRTVHAEANLVAFAAAAGVALRGCVVYSTHAPCYACAKLLLNAGVSELHFHRDYHDARGLALLQRRGVEVGYTPWH